MVERERGEKNELISGKHLPCAGREGATRVANGERCGWRSVIEEAILKGLSIYDDDHRHRHPIFGDHITAFHSTIPHPVSALSNKLISRFSSRRDPTLSSLKSHGNGTEHYRDVLIADLHKDRGQALQNENRTCQERLSDKCYRAD